MRSLTTIEAQLLRKLRSEVHSDSKESQGLKTIFVTEPDRRTPAVQVGLQLEGHPTLVYFNILVYGTRPVRYHIESEAGPGANKCRLLWNKLLGALNLNTEKSGERDGKLHLFYEVCYTDRELKRLGEK